MTAQIIDFYTAATKITNKYKRKTIKNIAQQKADARKKALNELISITNKFNLLTQMKYGKAKN